MGIEEELQNQSGLKDIKLRLVYESDMSSLVDDFYVPILSAATRYDRLTGFFSSTCLAIAARGIAGLIQNSGHIRLLTSPYLTQGDIDAIRERRDLTVVEKRMLNSLDDIKSAIESDYVAALGWMLREGFIELKIALVQNSLGEILSADEVKSSGIFHQKVGIVSDYQGNSLSFSGSINETASGWLSNIEEFKVFRSWVDAEKPYHDSDVSKFERYWNGQSYRIRIEDAPAAVVKELTRRSPIEKEDLAILGRELNRPRLCGKSQARNLWPHQVTAVREWLQAERRGILEMATGTGKTLAALSCICDTAESTESLIVVIAVPYRHIGDQWRESIEELNAGFEIVSADSTNRTWESEITHSFNRIMLGTMKNAIIITTHATFSSRRFINTILKQNTTKLLVVDEVHGAGAPMRVEGLLEAYEYRLGLSATPRRWFDDDGTDSLITFFGKVVFELPLDAALQLKNPRTGDPILVPYRYHPHFIGLDKDELQNYHEQTSKIGKVYHAARTDKERGDALVRLLNKRANIIKSARQKYAVLEQILGTLQNTGDLCRLLIYVSPEQIDSVRSLLIKRNIRQHKFTQHESADPDETGVSERERLLRKLEDGNYQVLISILCLDEGVDVPCVDKAIIMSSTGNPRQYIQRRGRILRFSPGKRVADIHDIIVMPTLSTIPESREIELRVIEREMKRYEEFASLALNRDDCMRKITFAEIEAGLFGKKRK